MTALSQPWRGSLVARGGGPAFTCSQAPGFRTLQTQSRDSSRRWAAGALPPQHWPPRLAGCLSRHGTASPAFWVMEP